MNRWLTAIGVCVAIVGALALTTCLGLTLTAIWNEKDPSKDLLTLTNSLLSSRVILGTLAAAGGAAFRHEISTRLKGGIK